MKLTFKFLVFLFIGTLAFSCFEAPEFSVIPEIEVDNVYFVDNPNGADSIVVSVRFKDGDGNIGISGDNLDEPFHPADFYLQSSTNTLVKIGTINPFTGCPPPDDVCPPFLNVGSNSGKLITNRTATNLVPDYNPDVVLGCVNYIKTRLLIRADDNVVDDTYNIVDTLSTQDATEYYLLEDTLYFTQNELQFNYLVKYFVENSQGVFEEFNWRTYLLPNSCGETFSGRIAAVTDREDIPTEGVIKHAMVSLGFKQLFSVKRLRIEVTLIDRDLNRSNTVSTKIFRLNDIKK